MNDMQAVFILYDWTSNAILAIPISDARDEIMIEAFRQNIEYLTKQGFKPTFNIIENFASNGIKAYLESEDIGIQLVEPNNHRVNATERATQTFKNHCIAGLCTCDVNFPTLLWCKLIRQCQDTLYMLRTSRVYPKGKGFPFLKRTHE